MRESRTTSVQARRTVLTGCALLACAIALLALPLALGRWEPDKYFVVVGLLLLFAGFGCVLHGAVDWIRARNAGA